MMEGLCFYFFQIPGNKAKGFKFHARPQTGAYSCLIEALIELRKMLIRKKLFDVRFGNCLTPNINIRYPDSADLQRCN